MQWKKNRTQVYHNFFDYYYFVFCYIMNFVKKIKTIKNTILKLKFYTNFSNLVFFFFIVLWTWEVLPDFTGFRLCLSQFQSTDLKVSLTCDGRQCLCFVYCPPPPVMSKRKSIELFTVCIEKKIAWYKTHRFGGVETIVLGFPRATLHQRVPLTAEVTYSNGMKWKKLLENKTWYPTDVHIKILYVFSILHHFC